MNIHKIIKRGAVVICGVFMLGLVACSGKGNKITYVNLDEYMGISDIAGNEGAAIVVDNENAGVGFIKDGAYYIPYEIVRKNIDGRYYWDEALKMLTYASSKHIYDVYVDSAEYKKDGVAATHTRAAVICVDNVPYIDKDYVLRMNSDMDVATFDNPNRVVVTVADEYKLSELSKDVKLKADLSDSGKVVVDLKKDQRVTVLESENGWAKVATEDGFTGYIDADIVKNEMIGTIDREPSWLDTEPYTYISRDTKVCLGWHQMEYGAGNDALNKMVSGKSSLNVISPTWFKIIDSYGGISSLASKTYVDNAHKKGLEVWGLISDFNYDENKNYYVNDVVKNTNSRRALIANIIEEAKKCGMDGINIDFEMIRLHAAEGYVQFMRELAIECEKIDIVLSVDMYVPIASNKYYNRAAIGEVADYLVIMGYDEHWAGCGEAGSVASLPYVTSGIDNTLKEVPASRVINAIPFYTRVWYEDTLDNAPDGAVIIEDAINGDYALSSKAVGMGDAKELIDKNKGSLRWIEELGQYYSEYYIGDRFARIWLEDKESLTLKLNVMKDRGLAGVACWKLGLDSKEAWEAIAEYTK